MKKNCNSMITSTLLKIVKLLILPSLFLGLTGCFTASPDDDRMPQGRPASWEYSLPGGFDRGGLR
jgi:hypothetical protein